MNISIVVNQNIRFIKTLLISPLFAMFTLYYFAFFLLLKIANGSITDKHSILKKRSKRYNNLYKAKMIIFLE